VDRRLGLAYLSLAAPGALALFVIPTAWAEEVFAVLAVGFPVALIAVGAARNGSLGPLRLPLLALTLILEGALLAMLTLRGSEAAGAWFGGLPPSAAVMLYVMFAAPLPLVGLAYALTFSGFTLREEDLEALDRMSLPGGRDSFRCRSSIDR
jgi:hypothetical protein